MKRKQLCSLITVALMATTLVTPYNTSETQAKEETSVKAASVDNAPFSYSFQKADNNSSSQNLGGTLTITNTSGAELDLSTVKLNYFFSSDSDVANNFYCDYCGIISGNYQNFTGSVKGEFEKTGDSDASKSDVLKIGFTSGKLQPGDVITLQYRVARNDWSNYDTTNDFGWGDRIVNPTINPESISFEESKAVDTNVKISYEGTKDAALNSIVEGSKTLQKGQDYTVDASGNVILKASYLNAISGTSATLTYNFNDKSSQTQTITIKKVQPTVSISDKVYNPEVPKDITTTVDYKNSKVTLTKVTNGNQNVKYTVDGNKVIIDQDYLESLKENKDKNITLTYWFSNGTKADVQITILGIHVMADISLGSVDVAHPGEIIEVPVNINNVTKFGLLDFQFGINYDASKFEYVGLEAAGLTEGFDDSFIEKENKAGYVSFQYLVQDDEEQIITTTGTLCKIKLKVKDDASEGLSKIEFKDSASKLNYFDEVNGVVGSYEKKLAGTDLDIKIIRPFTIDVDDQVFGRVGDEVVVPVRLTDRNTEDLLLDYAVTVVYDSNALEFESVEGAGLTEGFDDSFEVKNAGNGKVKVQYLISDDDEQDISSEGVLFNLRFKVKDTAKDGVSEITLTNPVFNSFNDELGTVGKFNPDLVGGSVLIAEQEPVDLKVDTVSSYAGTEVEVPVSLSGLGDRNAILDNELTIEYDTNKLEFVAPVGAGLTEGFDDSFEVKDAGNGKVRVQYLISDEDEQAITTDGILLNLKFKVKDGVSGVASVKIVDSKLNNFDDEAGVVGNYKARYTDGAVNVGLWTPKADLSTNRFDKANPKDITVTVNADGGEFKGIKEISGVDTSLDKIVIDKSYFSNKKGTADLTFVFEKDGKEVSIVKTVTIKEIEYKPSVELEKSEVFAGKEDVVADVDVQGGKLVSVDGAKYTVEGNKVILDKSSFTKVGTTKVVFNFEKDGQTKSISKTVTVKEYVIEPLTLEVGTASVKAGEEVTVPVTLSNLGSDYALLDNELTIEYDASKVEFVAPVGAGLTEGFDDSFEVKDLGNGKVRIQYLISDEDEQAITADGVLLNLTFKAKSTEGTAEVKIADSKLNYFDDAAGECKQFKAKYVNGAVNIVGVEPVELEVGTVDAKVSEEVNVPVKLSNLGSDYALLDNELTIEYDASKVEFVAPVGAGLTEGFDDSFEVKDLGNGKVRVQYLISDEDEQAITADGVLLNLTFKAKAEGTAVVKITDSKLNYFDDEAGECKQFKTNYVNGAVKVSKDEVTPDPLVSEVNLNNSVFDKNAPEDITATINTNGTFKGVKETSKVTKSGNKVVIDKSYFADKTGTATLTFEFEKDGETNTVVKTVTIKEKETPVVESLVLEVGTVNVEAGKEVDVPVTLSNFKSDYALLDNEITVEYDASKLEFVEPLGAGLTDGFDDSFEVKDLGDGKVRIQYLISDEDEQAITADGVLLNLTFKAKDDATGTATVKITDSKLNYFDDEEGVCGQFTAEYKAGAVNIQKEEEEVWNPSAKLNSSEFDKNNEADITAVINADGGKLTGIKEGAKYTQNGSTVTIDKSYFNAKTGKATVTFEFEKNGKVQSVAQTVTIKELEAYEPTVTLVNSEVEAGAEDVVANIDVKGGKLKGIDGASVNTVSGSKVTLDKSNFTEAGTKTITFNFEKNGKVVSKTVTVTVKAKEEDPVQNSLSVSADTVKAAAGSTVKVPVYMHIPETTAVYGVTFNYADSEGATYSKFTKNANLPKGTDVAFNYYKKSKTAFAYSVFPKEATGIRVTGDVLFGTLTINLDAGLASGTEIPVVITDVAFSDSAFKPVAAEYKAGKIIVE
ncbi:MAG: hypothetical protein K5986_07035 [Clostridium sp.]|nr:hypothetical protein [Clostridium sp.]